MASPWGLFLGNSKVSAKWSKCLVSDLFSSISMAFWASTPGLWLPWGGEGSDMTHSVLYWSSFFLLSLVVQLWCAYKSRWGELLGESMYYTALPRPSKFPFISTFSCLVWAMCPQLRPLTSGTDCAARRHVVWPLGSAEKAVLTEACDEMPGPTWQRPLRLSLLRFVDFLLIFG